MKKIKAIFLYMISIIGVCVSLSHAVTIDVSMRDSSFQPQDLTIDIGDTVRWTNNGALLHTTTSGINGNNVDGLWNSGTMSSGETFSLIFNQSGEFPYHCTFHWFSGMTGTITVNPETSTLPVPNEQQFIPYAPPVSMPELSNNPLQAEPIGIGPLALGGDMLNVTIGLNQTSAPVDVYAAYSRLSDPSIVNILLPGGFTPFEISQIVNSIVTGTPLAGFEPWMSSTMGPIDEDLLNIPVSSLPPGGYTAYLLVTQAGVLNNFYVWIMSFIIP